MSNSVVVGVVVGIVALCACLWYYSDMQFVAHVGDATRERVLTGNTFSELLGSKQSLECTFEYNDGANMSSGTVYVAEGGERVRSDITFTRSATGPMEMHTVHIDGYNYVWGSTMPQGIKRQATAENYAHVFGGDVAMSAMSDTAQYTCVAWNSDSNKFTLPSNVTFMDIGDKSKMMGAPKIGEATRVNGSAGASTNVDIKAMQCAACDQTGAAKEQCRKAIGCL